MATKSLGGKVKRPLSRWVLAVVAAIPLCFGLVQAAATVPASAYTAQGCVNSEAIAFLPPITGITVTSGTAADFQVANCERYTAPASVQNVQYSSSAYPSYLGGCEIVLLNDGLSGFLVDGGIGLTYGASPPFASVKLLVFNPVSDTCPLQSVTTAGDSVGVGALG